MHSHVNNETLQNQFLAKVVKVLHNRAKLNQAVIKGNYLRLGNEAVSLDTAIVIPTLESNDFSDKIRADVTFNRNKLSEHYESLAATDTVKIAIHAATSVVIGQWNLEHKKNKAMSGWLANHAHQTVADYVKQYGEDLNSLNDLSSLPKPEKLAAVQKQDMLVKPIEDKAENKAAIDKFDYENKCTAALDKIKQILTKYFETLVDKSYAVYPKNSLSNKEFIKQEISKVLCNEKFEHDKDGLSVTAVNKLQQLHQEAQAIIPLIKIIDDKSLDSTSKARNFAQQFAGSAKPILQTGEKSARHKLAQVAYVLANIIPGLGFLVSFIKNGTPKFWQTKSQQVASKVNNVLKAKTGLLTVKGKFASRKLPAEPSQIDRRPRVKP